MNGKGNLPVKIGEMSMHYKKKSSINQYELEYWLIYCTSIPSSALEKILNSERPLALKFFFTGVLNAFQGRAYLNRLSAV